MAEGNGSLHVHLQYQTVFKYCQQGLRGIQAQTVVVLATNYYTSGDENRRWGVSLRESEDFFESI